MKTKFYFAIIVMIALAFHNKSNAQANKSLSNLTSPTAVNVSLLPDRAYKHDLGMVNKSWGDLYIDSVIYFHGARFLSYPHWQTNTALSFGALASVSSGQGNIAIGFYSLEKTTTGGDNTAIGYLAGDNVTAGSNNTFVGAGTNSGSGGVLTNSTAIGYGATVTASNKIVVGDAFVASIGGYANWTNFSDGRFKKNIKENVQGLSFINQLKPITYTLDVKAINHFLGVDERLNNNDKAGEIINDAIAQKAQIVYSGFVAQDVEAAAQKVGYDFSGVDAAKTDKDYYGLRYAEFVVPLVKAVQELSQQNDELSAELLAEKKQNDAQQKINVDLQTRLAKLEAMMNTSTLSTVNYQQPTVLSASLPQNIPNPFNHTTTINYTLPQQFSSAKIIITDKSGKILKEMNLTTRGKGSLNIDASVLPSGAYQYSMYVDGKLIDTKQMGHIK